jgi:hypothetical protein
MTFPFQGVCDRLGVLMIFRKLRQAQVFPPLVKVSFVRLVSVPRRRNLIVSRGVSTPDGTLTWVSLAVKRRRW